MRRLRRATTGLVSALLLQVGAGSRALPCGSHSARTVGSASPVAVVGRNVDHSHEAMPCDQTAADRGGPSENHEDCPLPSGHSSDCGLMVGCTSVVAEASAVRSVSAAQSAFQNTSFSGHAPAIVFIGPDHPPPRV